MGMLSSLPVYRSMKGLPGIPKKNVLLRLSKGALEVANISLS